MPQALRHPQTMAAHGRRRASCAGHYEDTKFNQEPPRDHTPFFILWRGPMEEPNDDAGRQQLGSSCRTRRQGERLGPTATQCWGAVQGTRVQLRPSALNALGQRARQPAAEWELGGRPERCPCGVSSAVRQAECAEARGSDRLTQARRFLGSRSRSSPNWSWGAMRCTPFPKRGN